MSDRYHLLPLETLFRRNFKISWNGCWVWIGRLYPNGYGQFHVRRRVTYAHRFGYETRKGKIPEGKSIDHLCRNRSCVNPEHLEAVDHIVNVRRGNAVKKACKNGHAFNQENTWLDRYGWKHCRVCWRDKKEKEKEPYPRSDPKHSRLNKRGSENGDQNNRSV